MLSRPPTVKIYLGAEPTDMRKGFEGSSRSPRPCGQSESHPDRHRRGSIAPAPRTHVTGSGSTPFSARAPVL
jgi:hypothetical protein